MENKNSFNREIKIFIYKIKAASGSMKEKKKFALISACRRYSKVSENHESTRTDPRFKLLSTALLISLVRLCNKPRIASKLTCSSKRNKRFPVHPLYATLSSIRVINFIGVNRFHRRIFKRECRSARGNGLARYSLRQFQSASMPGVSVI